MTAAKDKATITSILFAKFYESVGTVTANGSVTMAFGASATPLLQLNGAPIDFDSSSNAIYSDTELSLVDGTHADINATTVGDFGSLDFSVELTISSTGGDITPDDDWGTFFGRSSNLDQPNTGPSASVDNNGQIMFRMRNDDDMMCQDALPGNQDSEAYIRKLKFERSDSTLSLTISTIDGVVVKECTKVMDPEKTINTLLFVNEPVRFGRYQAFNGGNLRATLSNIKLVGETRVVVADVVNRRLGGTNNNNRRRRRHLQDGGTAKSAFDVSVDLNKAEDGPVALQQTAGAGAGTSITVVATIVGLVSALLLA